jgi:hypothetical protein
MLKLAIKQAGKIVNKSRDAKRAELVAEYRDVCLRMQKRWVRSMLER